MFSCSVMSNSLQPMDCSLQDSSMEFARQEYWSGLVFPTPGDLPDPGIVLTSPTLVGGFFTTGPLGSHHQHFDGIQSRWTRWDLEETKKLRTKLWACHCSEVRVVRKNHWWKLSRSGQWSRRVKRKEYFRNQEEKVFWKGKRCWKD